MKFLSVRFFVIAVMFFAVSTANTAEAASLYIDPPKSSLNRGDAVTMSVRLDTDELIGECINAVDGVISYTSNIEPVDVSIGSSILNVWVEEPTINREDKTITFAGGIPNGYCGRVDGDPRLTNTLVQIVFRSPGFSIGGGDEKTALVSLTDASTAYLNDGRGTKASLTTYPAKIELGSGAGAELVNPWQEAVDGDTIPPTEFSISLQKDEMAFSQKYYIVFSTTDKQTGVDHYEVMEEPLTQVGSFQWGRADAPWITARSPYVLDDQSLNSIIRVKAIDKAGNEYIANLIPDDSMRTVSVGQILSMAMAGVGLAVLALVVFLFVRLSKKRKNKQPHEIEEDMDSNDFEADIEGDEYEGREDSGDSQNEYDKN